MGGEVDMAQFAARGWQRVPIGELTSLQGRLRWRRRLHQLGTAALAAFTLGAIALAVEAVAPAIPWHVVGTGHQGGTTAPSCPSDCNTGGERCRD